MERSRVALISSKQYGEETKRAVKTAVDSIGGIKQVVQPGDVVLLKPNLVNAYTAESGNITHYSLLEPIIEACYGAGASKIFIGEGTGSYETLTTFIASGMKKVVDRLCSDGFPVEFVDLNCDKNPKTNKFDEVNLGKEGLTPNFTFRIPHTVMSADTIISVPKLKAHSLTGISVALKNMVGIAPSEFYGFPKKRGNALPHGNYKLTLKNDVLWRVILDLNRIVLGRYSGSPKEKKYLTVVDGVVAGAYSKTINSGDTYWLAVWKPVNVGAIIAGLDPVAVDTVSARLMCYRPEKIPTLVHASETGLGTMTNIEIVGEKIKNIRKFVPQSKGFFSIVDLQLPAVLPKALYYAFKTNTSEFLNLRKPLIYASLKKHGFC